jgi:hypothetical protein
LCIDTPVEAPNNSSLIRPTSSGRDGLFSTLRTVPALDRWLPDFDVHEVHAVTVPDAPEAALARALALPAAPDRIVRTLFRLRGIRGGDLPLERFAQEVLRLEQVEQTPTTAVAVGGRPRLRLGISFGAEPVTGGSRLVTETRVTAADRRALFVFRAYWLFIGPFSALIRRRWLHALSH